jgi:hypothetical protein
MAMDVLALLRQIVQSPCHGIASQTMRSSVQNKKRAEHELLAGGVVDQPGQVLINTHKL